MGLLDREYAREADDPRGLAAARFLPFNTWLIIANVAVFVIQVFLPQTTRMLEARVPATMDFVTYWGHFSTARILQGLEVWRVITFQFLHASPLHLFFNMFGLWVFGGMVERHLGFKKYAAFYLVCGIAGALMYLVLNLGGYMFARMGWPQVPGLLFEGTWVPLVGASAGCFGVIMASAFIAPNAVVQLLFPPIPLRIKLLAYGYVAIAVFNLFSGSQNAGGEAAHLGGAMAGYFFIRNSHLLLDFFDVLGDSRPVGRSARSGNLGALFSRARGPDQAEIDRILAKVHTDGLHSLNDKERNALRAATESQRR
jgi:membrane associated rhomboid family serine protease